MIFKYKYNSYHVEPSALTSYLNAEYDESQKRMKEFNAQNPTERNHTIITSFTQKILSILDYSFNEYPNCTHDDKYPRPRYRESKLAYLKRLNDAPKIDISLKCFLLHIFDINVQNEHAISLLPSSAKHKISKKLKSTTDTDLTYAVVSNKNTNPIRRDSGGSVSIADLLSGNNCYINIEDSYFQNKDEDVYVMDLKFASKNNEIICLHDQERNATSWMNQCLSVCREIICWIENFDQFKQPQANDKDLRNQAIEYMEKQYLESLYEILKEAELDMKKECTSEERIRSYWGMQIEPNATRIPVSHQPLPPRYAHVNTNSKPIDMSHMTTLIRALFDAQEFEVHNAYLPCPSRFLFKANGVFLRVEITPISVTNIGTFSDPRFFASHQDNNMIVKRVKELERRAFLPKDSSEPCITFFIDVLHDINIKRALAITMMCIPSANLYASYEPISRAIQNPEKTRFSVRDVDKFKLLKGDPSRIKVMYFNENMNEKYMSKLQYAYRIYQSQRTSA